MARFFRWLFGIKDQRAVVQEGAISLGQYRQMRNIDPPSSGQPVSNRRPPSGPDQDSSLEFLGRASDGKLIFRTNGTDPKEIQEIEDRLNRNLKPEVGRAKVISSAD